MSMDNPHEENRTRKPYMTWAGLMFAASILFSATSFQLLAGICVLLFLLFAIIGLADKYVTNRGVPVRKDRALNIFAWLLGFAAILTILLQLLIPAIYSARMAAKRAEETKEAQFNTEHPPKDGPVVEYYENGKKKSEGNFKNSLQDGLWTIWHENGQKKEEGHFINGSPDGLWTLWDKDGNKTRVILFKDGEMVVLE
jgi:hypothetical protein